MASHNPILNEQFIESVLNKVIKARVKSKNKKLMVQNVKCWYDMIQGGLSVSIDLKYYRISYVISDYILRENNVHDVMIEVVKKFEFELEKIKELFSKIKNRNDALLNCKSDDKLLRDFCINVIKGKIKIDDIKQIRDVDQFEEAEWIINHT